MLNQLKAIAAGVVGVVATLLSSKFGFDLSTEMQTAIVGGILYIVVYLVPNLKTA
jgi:hypothetical protein